MDQQLFEFLRLLSSFIVLLPLLVALVRSKQLVLIQKKLVLLLILVLIVETIANILWYQKRNNLAVYHFYAIFEFILIANIYKTALRKLFPGTFFYVIAIVFACFAILNMILWQPLQVFNSNVTTTLCIVIILLSLCYFYALLKEVKYAALEKNPMFWINAGFLIYFSTNLLLFYINNQLLTKASNVSYLLWGMHAIVNCIQIIFFTIAVWIRAKQR